MMEQPLRIKWGLAVLLGILIAIALFFAFSFFYNIANNGKIIPGLRISGVEIGGLHVKDAEEKLRREFNYGTAAAFAFTYQNDIWHAIPDELGIRMDIEATLRDAYLYGRNTNFLFNIFDQFSALLFKADSVAVFLFDERDAFQFVDSLAALIDVPIEQPRITLQGASVEIVPGKSGRALNRDMTMTLIQIYGQNLQTGTINLPVVVLDPSVEKLEAQKAMLENLLSTDFILTFAGVALQDANTRISADLLAGWLTFEPEIHDTVVSVQIVPKREPFYNRLVKLSAEIFAEAQNARFVFNDDTHRLEPIAGAVVGRELDIEASLTKIADALQSGEHQAELSVIETLPSVFETANGADLGIIELAENVSTYFFYSSPERIQNITTAAAIFHGLLVAPGETFSMNRHLGEIDVDNGFAEAAVIFGNQTVQGIGGGICQVSTTLFRTAFNYGLPINERYAHAYRVYYYERQANAQIDPSMAGMDASIYVPQLDFKFTNDTPYWILMETYVNPQASRITWKFYSTDANRYVEWKTSGMTNIEQPGEPTYRENYELAAGEIKQLDYAIEGSDISITRTVYQNGTLHLQDRYDTHYAAVADGFEYGPGTIGMPPEK